MNTSDYLLYTALFAAILAYGQSKTANALFAVGLILRHAADGITATP